MLSRIRLVTLIAVLPAMLSWGSGAQAGSVDDARREVERIVDTLESLSDEAVQLGEVYEESVAALDEVKLELADLDRRVAELEGRISTLDSAVAALALQTFVGADQGGGIAVLLTGGGSANEETERLVYFELATSASASSVDELQAATSDLEDVRRERAEKEERVELAIARSAEQQQAVERKTAEYEKLREEAEADLGQAIDNERRRREQEEERRASATRPTPPSLSSGSKATPAPSPVAGGASPTSAGGQATEETPSTPAPEPEQPSDNSTNDQPRAGTSVPSPSPGASGAVQAAMSQLGVPYKYATAEPGVNFDCSGLTMWAWGQAGVSLPHYSKSQFEMLPKVPADQAQPGDLIFYRTPVGHVALYIGNGQLIHAPRTGDVVKISTVNWDKVRDGVVGRPG